MPNPNPSPLTRFKPGNPGGPGRPRGSKSITTRLREALESDTVGGKPLPDGKTVADVLVEAIIGHAVSGSVPHLNTIMERVEGKVPDKLDATVDLGGVSDAELVARIASLAGGGGAAEPGAAPGPDGRDRPPGDVP